MNQDLLDTMIGSGEALADTKAAEAHYQAAMASEADGKRDTAAVLGYAVGHFHDSVWKGARWRTTAKFIFDGVVYGLVTAGTFGWLRPDAV